jgi:hypothetical protein
MTVTGLQHSCGESARAAKFPQPRSPNWFIEADGFADGRFPRIHLTKATRGGVDESNSTDHPVRIARRLSVQPDATGVLDNPVSGLSAF